MSILGKSEILRVFESLIVGATYMFARITFKTSTYLFLKFILRECERASRTEAERERESQAGSVLSAQSRMWAAPKNREIIT